MSASAPKALELQLSTKEYAAFFGEALARRRLYRWLWPHRWFGLGLIFLALILIAMVAGGSEEWWDDPRARFAISAAVGAFILLVTFFDPLFSALVIRRRVRRGQYAVTLNPTRIEVTPACVRTIDLPSNATQEWPSIRTIRLSQSGGIVYLPTGSVLLIPRRCFATDAAFMDFLESINRLPRDGR